MPYDVPLCSYKSGMKIALLPGDRVFGDVVEEPAEDSGENSEKQEETDDFYNDEKVKEIMEYLLKPEKLNHPIETDLPSY